MTKFPRSYAVLVRWKRWRAWRPVRLQHSRRWTRPGTMVEYERIQIPIFTAVGGRTISRTVTHYRLAL